MARRVKGTFRSTAVTTSARSRAEGSVSQHSRESVRARIQIPMRAGVLPADATKIGSSTTRRVKILIRYAASLGCGNPVAVAELREGDKVLDLGSGGGFDVLLSAQRVGPSGFAYGVDRTNEMLDLARANTGLILAAGSEPAERTALTRQSRGQPYPSGSAWR